MPGYYHSYAPFRRLFETGAPVLTYHKLGPRPRGARLKGLYVSARLFERQLAELHAAGFASAPIAAALAPPGRPARRVAITFDDGFACVAQHGLDALARHGFHAIQFLVSDRLGATNDWDADEAPERLMDERQTREWLAAGHSIGAHTRTHAWLTRIPAAQAREEIRASKAALEDRFGVPVEDFCYPYGDWNPAVRDEVAAAGYRTACTVEPGVNTPATPPFEIRRLTARYPSRNFKALWGRLRALVSGG